MSNETASFDVVIFDESDPVLAIVLPANSDTPVWHRDYEGVYDRELGEPETNYAEWLVNKKFVYTADSSRFNQVDLTLHSFDQELFHIIRVTFSKRTS